MSYKLYITKEAHEDLNDIISYISKKLCNPIAANNLLSEIEHSYMQITDNPRAYAFCVNKRLRNIGYRKFIVKNILFFTKQMKTKKLHISCALYTVDGIIQI